MDIFISVISLIVQVVIIVVFYGIIRHFGNCPTCGRRISNDEQVCSFCGTERSSGLVDAKCPLCEKSYRMHPAQEGRTVNCPFCKKSIKATKLVEQVERLPEQVRIRCFLCGNDFDIASFQQGTVVQCPHCKKSVRAS